MLFKAVIRYMSLLVVIWQAKATSNKVEQFDRVVKVSKGGNVTMYCKYKLLQDIADVSWWKEGEKTFIEPDSKTQFRENRAMSTFTLLNASVADIGMYYCQVKHRQQIIGNGSGSQLIVLTPPTPLNIVPVETTSPHSRKLACKTAPFYPEELEIIWRRNNMDIRTGVETETRTTAEGFYEASSVLEDSQLALGRAVYTCLVSHEALTMPASFSYVFEQDSKSTYESLIFPCIVGGSAILVLIIILTIVALKRKPGRDTIAVEEIRTGNPAGQESPGHGSALNLSEDRRFPKVRHQEEQTKTGGAEKLTYASLQLQKSNKTTAFNEKDARAVYAGVKVSREARS
ncbi:tyrosine-protein phosphatase non-receptor type substrate 1-like isoform X2 [Narcine bancroftii]|uniref:tyrosine-protein phosphatase non-receptor type substrate 1-like isoform X2 n=1 Tax=Narcine bancroftii TaxID=1343680 RepID=UPI003831A590